MPFIGAKSEEDEEEGRLPLLLRHFVLCKREERVSFQRPTAIAQLSRLHVLYCHEAHRGCAHPCGLAHS